jgi:hypothetical protein
LFPAKRRPETIDRCGMIIYYIPKAKARLVSLSPRLERIVTIVKANMHRENTIRQPTVALKEY